MKFKVVPVHKIKAYGGSRGIDPLILDLGTRWRRVNNCTLPGSFASEDRTPGTHWIAGWMDSKAGPDVLKKRKILDLSGNEVVQPVALAHHIKHSISAQQKQFTNCSTPIDIRPLQKLELIFSLSSQISRNEVATHFKLILTNSNTGLRYPLC